MVETAISIAVENRQKAFVLHRTPGGHGGRHRIVIPSRVGLVVVLPAGVGRRVFDMLYGWD
jgi:hypothetical protein